MRKLPVFRIIHRTEAQDHARLICKRMKLRKGTKDYKKIYDQGILQYIQDAMTSLYPSGELSTQNPTKRILSSAEQAKKDHKVMSKLTDTQYKNLIKSKDTAKYFEIVDLHKKWHNNYNKHLTRRDKIKYLYGGETIPEGEKKINPEISYTEKQKMLAIEKRLMVLLARGKSKNSKARIVLNFLKKDYASVLKDLDKNLSNVAKKKFKI